MKRAIKSAGLLVLGIGLTLSGYAQVNSTLWESIKNPAIAAQLKRFVSEKEAQANAATNKMPADIPAFFVAAKKGDWPAVSNIFESLRNGSYPKDTSWLGTQWETVREIWGTFFAFGEGNEKYSAMFADDIIQSIPPGSIYFGGTDQGRFIITAMQKSHVDGDPFFTLTQNALADGPYLGYLRSMYGGKICVPTPDDLKKCYDNYVDGARMRFKNHQLKPGENVTQDSSGHLQIKGEEAVMEINALVAKIIFDKNTNHEFCVERSFGFDWMYPYLEPRGLIFKLNRQPLPELSDEVVQRDHDFWTKCVTPMIGDWLNADTPVSEVAVFAEKVFLRHDFSGFKGDPAFVQNACSHWMFSKERSSIAGLYAWRAQHATDAGEKRRMNVAADFAFRQAWALCPYNVDAVYGYVQFLMDENRSSDAFLVAETAAKFRSQPGAKERQNLIVQLKQYLKAR